MRKHYVRSFLVFGGGLVLLGVLGLRQYAAAQQPAEPGAGKAPFINAIDQRAEMIRELQEIRKLMKEQNAYLKHLVEKADAGAKAK